jgi:hydrogenase nickel incorporation protein HypA/HybF
MHELSIAQSIIDTVRRTADENGYLLVVEIGLRIGALTDIVPDALRFGFEIAVKATPLESTRLVIETIPIGASCRSCGRDFVVEQFLFVCPACGGSNLTTKSGDELEIAYIEVDDDTDQPGDSGG